MKKVLFFSSWPLFDKNGNILIPFIYEQIGVLANHVEAIYVEPEFLSFPKWLLTPKKNKCELLSKTKWENKGLVSHYKLKLPKVSTRLTKREVWDDFFWAGKYAASILEREIGIPYLIHLHTALSLGPLALSLKARWDTPIIYQEHSAPFEMHLKTERKRKWVRRLITESDVIIPVGPGLRDRILTFESKGQPKTFVIPEMIRADLFDLKHNNQIKNYYKLISIGGLVERKGYQHLVKAVKGLIGDGFKVQLTIVGEGNYRGQLEAIIDELKLSEHVTLTGQLNKHQINKELENSNIYVHSSLRETFGIAPTEAMLKGIPVVSTKCEGPEYYIDHRNGILVEPGSPDQLKHGIKRMIQELKDFDPVMVRKSVEDLFGEHAFVEQMTKIYAKYA